MSPGAKPPENDHDAQDALDALKAALDAAGLTLPSLGIDPAYSTGPTWYRFPLIELGRARPDVVMALAQVIQRGAER